MNNLINNSRYKLEYYDNWIGFGSTGSSVITDYLLEFGNVKVLDQIEFTWVTGVDGLIDLDFHVNHPHTRTGDSIIAIRRYRERAKKSLHYYEKAGGVDSSKFMESVDKFLDAITQVKWYWDMERPNDFWGNNIRKITDRIIPRVEKKLGRQLNCWPMKEVSLSVAPKNFEQAAKIHVREILELMGADFSKPIILDQPFSGNNPQACFKFFDDPFAVVVDRDPRDNYVFANTRLLGVNHFMAVSPVEDFVNYYRAIREGQPYKKDNDHVMHIKFEDMVYHYEETTTKLRNFFHLGDNPNPKSIFDPVISMPNTQVWKRFPQYAKDIEYIEKELAEYLFDYSGCPEPDPNGKMFFGQSPKHK